jgi:Spy/CpxP family protein refolding chaperone
MKIRQTLTATALAIGLSAVPMFAQPGPGYQGGKHAMRGGEFAGGFHGRMAQALNLTDAQKEFAKQARADAKAQAEPVANELRQVRQELAEAVKTNNTGAIQNLATRQGNLQGQLAVIHANSMAKLYAQLTPEQKAKAEELRTQRQDRMKNRQERMQKRQGETTAPAQQ